MKKTIITIVVTAIIAVIGTVAVIGIMRYQFMKKHGAFDQTATVEEPELAPHAEDDGYEMIAELQEEDVEMLQKVADGEAGAITDDEVTNEPASEFGPEDELPEADSTDAPEETILEDPYGMYVVTEDWLKEYGGYVVERNSQLYAFYSQYGVMGDVPEKYDVGYELGGRGYNWTYLYCPDVQEIKDVPTNATGKIATSAGDFPIFEVSKNEEIRVYNKDVVDEIELFPASFYGYCVNATHVGNSYRPIINYELGVDRGIIDAERPVIYDMNDNPVSDVYNLEYSQDYKYGWFEGTEYHEISLWAGSRCYTVDKNTRVQVPVELTRNGYAVMDVSGLTPGIYSWQNSVFQITD